MSVEDRRNSLRKSSIGIDSIIKTDKKNKSTEVKINKTRW